MVTVLEHRAFTFGERTPSVCLLYRPRLQNSYLLTRRALVLAEAPVYFGFGVLSSISVPLLQASYQLIPLSFNTIEVIISEVSPPFLDLPTHLLPLPFHHISIHPSLLLYIQHPIRGHILMTPATPSRSLRRTESKIYARPPDALHSL